MVRRRKNPSALQLATIDLYTGQQRTDESGGSACDLVCSLTFTQELIQTNWGPLRVGTREAILSLGFENSEMFPRDVGYKRSPANRKTAELVSKSNTKKRQSISGKAEGSINPMTIVGNISASLGGGKESLNEEKETTSTVSDVWLVSFRKRVSDTNSVEWQVQDINNDSLSGEVIGESDEHGGVLGLLRYEDDSSWRVQPEIILQPYAQTVDDRGLTDEQRKKMWHEMNQKPHKEVSQKLGIVAAILQKTKAISHVKLDALEGKRDEDA
jgi:hypothetical protein